MGDTFDNIQEARTFFVLGGLRAGKTSAAIEACKQFLAQHDMVAVCTGDSQCFVQMNGSNYSGKEAAHQVNQIGDAVMKIANKQYRKSKSQHYIPRLLIYVGHRQFGALMHIDLGDIQRMTEHNGEYQFLSHRVVVVQNDNHLHVVCMNPVGEGGCEVSASICSA
jgi:hypothetical protein